MNPKAVKKHILEELAHGRPIQRILNPEAAKIPATDPETCVVVLVDDPDWVKPDLPDWNMVVQWLKDDEEFRRDYEHAMKYGAIYLADEMLILKDALLKDPKNASAYKTAMEMIKVSAMWRDPKYSERTIQEIKNTVPQDADVVLARMRQLEEELGIQGAVIDVPMIEVKPKISERMRLHLEKARAAAAEARARKRKQGNV